MFCEDLRNTAISERPKQRPTRTGGRVRPKSLYVSLWHCADCARGVRVYASLAQVLAGSPANDCPDCTSEMDPLPAQGVEGPSGSGLSPMAFSPSAFAA
jgi:hypothetical protein